MAYPLTITVDANSSAAANPFTSTSNAPTTNNTVNFKSPGAKGGSTGGGAAAAGGIDIQSIAQLGFYALIFIFVIKEIQGGNR